MKKINISSINQNVSAVALGLMRIANLDIDKATNLINTAYEIGINFFDHADIYGGGLCEEIFGQAIKRTNISREDIIIQTKCGIRPFDNWSFTTYDSSKEYILSQVHSSLKRLDVDYIDVLLLHRPDTLTEPQEVAETFSKLKKEGLVKYFGVSNYTPMQIELLQKYLDMPIVFNQLQFGLGHTHMIDRGFYANRGEQQATDFTGDVLEYCRYKEITIQAWSPFQSKEGVIFDKTKYPELNKAIDEIALNYGVSNTTIATSWILRHPANMQVIIGSTNVERLKDAVKNINLTSEEWYNLYKKTGVTLP